MLKGFCCILGFTAPWLFFVVCVALLIVLWAFVRLRRLCRKAWPIAAGVFVHAGRLLLQSVIQTTACALWNSALYLVWSFGSSYIIKPVPVFVCNAYVNQVRMFATAQNMSHIALYSFAACNTCTSS